jgi:hypothetical protein
MGSLKWQRRRLAAFKANVTARQAKETGTCTMFFFLHVQSETNRRGFLVCHAQSGEEDNNFL